MFKSFFKILMMAMMVSFDEFEGGGGEGDDPSGDSTPNPQPAPADNGGDNITLSKAELAELIAPVQEYAQEKAINTATADIATRHEGFDIKKVGEYLMDLRKTDPKKADELNNPQGWELIHIREFAAKEVKTDEVNGGRNVSGDSDRGDLIKKINSGNGSIDDHTELFMKYA